MRLNTLRFSTALIAALTLPAVLPSQERVDVATIERIKDVAMNQSQVMDIMSWLTDVHGPRLTGSPITRMAGEWAVSTMKSWGMSNPRFETWGPFGRGWTNERFYFQATAPHPFIIQAVPRAWSASTSGKVGGPAIVILTDTNTTLASLKSEYGGKLKGAFILATPMRNVSASFNPLAGRYTDDALAGLAAIVPAVQNPNGPRRQAGTTPPRRPFAMTSDTASLRWLESEGVGAILLPSSRGDGGTIFTDNGASRAPNAAKVPMVHLGIESYGRLWRSLERKVPVTLEMDMQNKFYDADLNSFNVIAEIPGTDPVLKDEIVMLGGHFDSWHGGTGATDNAAGSATMMEAVRILKSLNLQPRRTIRIALWTGEEQGLFGSRAYVTDHFAARDSTGLKIKPDHAKFSAYFNLDNGTGKIRGVYQQMNAEVGPIFDAWMGPFKADGMKTLTISNTGGTDHQAFDAVGLPGFQFIQDAVEYGSRTHHSNMDTYERIQADDMKWNSAVLAAFVWQAAQRDEKLPRKPMPAAPGARP
jgi:hypothetical protein